MPPPIQHLLHRGPVCVRAGGGWRQPARVATEARAPPPPPLDGARRRLPPAAHRREGLGTRRDVRARGAARGARAGWRWCSTRSGKVSNVVMDQQFLRSAPTWRRCVDEAFRAVKVPRFEGRPVPRAVDVRGALNRRAAEHNEEPCGGRHRSPSIRLAWRSRRPSCSTSTSRRETRALRRRGAGLDRRQEAQGARRSLVRRRPALRAARAAPLPRLGLRSAAPPTARQGALQARRDGERRRGRWGTSWSPLRPGWYAAALALKNRRDPGGGGSSATDPRVPLFIGDHESRAPRFSRRTRLYLVRRAFRYYRALTARLDPLRGTARPSGPPSFSTRIAT